jgi:uroporphyrinogen decarboxylase
MVPRDIVKLAFHYQETEEVPHVLWLGKNHSEQLTRYYGGDSWRKDLVDYVAVLAGIDNFMSYAGFTQQDDGAQRDAFGCAWQMGSSHHQVGWPLQEPVVGDYQFPDLDDYFARHIHPRWETQILQSQDQFRMVMQSFGLFERSWSLRGFENFMVDMGTDEAFVEEILDRVMDWIMLSVDHIAGAPIDCIRFTDDHSGQRGMLMGAERWRRLFKPRWQRIFERVHRYGMYAVLHVCGDTSEVVGDLVDVGLDCLESLQPECMDIYKLKQTYGSHLRFWGGLGAQSIIPFGTADEIRKECRRLKQEMGSCGGYIFAPTKTPGPEAPIENIAAIVEEAVRSRGAR